MNRTRYPAQPAGLPVVPMEHSAPPPPRQVAAFLGWMVRFWKAQRKHRAGSRHSPGPPEAGSISARTIVVALGTDLAMLAVKATAAAVTGSVALLAETLHSLADTANQLLLLKGLRRARSRPDSRHPLGYGSEVFYWSLLAALGVFFFGGLLSIWEGVHRLLIPGDLQSPLLGFGVLGMGFLLDGASWLTSVRQLRRESASARVSLRHYLHSTTDTAVAAVYFEDAAALVGNLVALAGLTIHQVVHSPVPDAAAGVVIGLLLSVIGWRLARRNRDLLTNRSESPLVLDRIRAVLLAGPRVTAVGPVTGIYVGPRQLLVLAEIQPDNAVSGPDLRRAIADLRGKVMQAVPKATAVFLMPVPEVQPVPEPTPQDLEYWLRLFPDPEQV